MRELRDRRSKGQSVGRAYNRYDVGGRWYLFVDHGLRHEIFNVRDDGKAISIANLCPTDFAERMVPF